MLKDFLRFDSIGNNYAEIENSIRQGVPMAVFGLSFSAKCHVIGYAEKPALIITDSVLSAEKIAEEVTGLSGENATVLYPKDEVLLYNKAFSKYSLFKRLNALYQIKKGAKIVVSTFESILQLLPKKLKVISLDRGGSYDMDGLVKELVLMGYTREEVVENKGCFSRRGDILEVFPINAEHPYKIDFFGDEIENIKQYEEETRNKISYADSIEILTATDVFIEDYEKPEIVKILKSDVKKAKNNEAAVFRRGIADELTEGLESGTFISGSSVLMPLIANATNDVFEYLAEDTVVFFDECKKLKDGLAAVLSEHKERAKSLTLGGHFTFTEAQLTDYDVLINRLNKRANVAIQTLATETAFFSPLKIVNVKTGASPKYRYKTEELIGDVVNWLHSGYRIVVFAGNKERENALLGELSFLNPVRRTNDFEKGVMVLPDKLSDGLIVHDGKLVIIGTGDIFSKKTGERAKVKRKNEFFSAPEVGDIAVHEVHGIGIVRGTKKISSTEGTKEYIAVEYAGGDLLYVSVEQMDSLSRYLGGDKKPALSKIGGRDFERVKERARQSIKEMSFDLKELYQERAEQKGFSFEDDGEMQELFDEAFSFEETPDQLLADEDIKADMCSGKVMDRLVCGDVGFGKTEVAFRAVFRAVVNHKQAVLLAPTTILTEQHYKTAVERFKDFGVNIAVLNRFKSKKEQTEILRDLKEGKIDFIIGTHRLLGKDVRFNDLGLLVLDEEQRFGVEHKEKIKLLKNNVDTITLTATPIPRTLHMSLAGIRDISTINTPPKERLPVQTYVTEESDSLIVSAINRELARNGQVFILYNRVETIYNFAEKVRSLLPGAKITVAHGQMDENTLENAILDFYEGKSDVLIATTIIENGIDLPKANTIIVIDADTLGLSTLYQLRGRVGRSNRLAHAYFTFKRDKVMNENAYKRLTAIMDFTEMGSGFKIAMRDLEIRGAGNVLGKQQHGHMDKIGYELFSKLLKEELFEEKEKIVNMDVRVNAYIPDDYIKRNSLRMDLYKEIAEIKGQKDAEEIKNQLFDLYGRVPKAVENLIDIALVKSLAAEFDAKEVTVKKETAEIVFDSVEAFGNMAIRDAAEEMKGVAYMIFSVKPAIELRIDLPTNEKCLAEIKRFFLSACTFNKKTPKNQSK